MLALSLLNVSIVAYCDDIILISFTAAHYCGEYAKKWKMEFNPSKSVSYCCGNSVKKNFKLNQQMIPSVDGFTYLGLPIGNEEYIFNYFDEKMRSVECSFYYLKGLGCKPQSMNSQELLRLYTNSSVSQLLNMALKTSI